MSRKITLSDVGELALIERVRRQFSSPAADVLLGIGDDSAVVRPGRNKLLLTTDMMTENVHFDLTWTTPYQIGFKVISSNVSDIYAMGGKPAYALLNLAVPADAALSLVSRFFEGVEKALKTYGALLIGGDLSASDRMTAAATLVGYAERVVTRGGASAGDRIYVSGPLGDAACGLDLLRRVGKPVEIERGKRISYPLQWNIAAPLLRRHLFAEVKKPGPFRKVATAMMDISDGLLIDLSRICRESGVGALLYEEHIPMSEEMVRAAGFLGVSPLSYALGGGEDYELLFTAPAGTRVRGKCIGEITGRGLKIRDKEGRVRTLSSEGYQHFAV